jgi:hypothetical protein
MPARMFSTVFRAWTQRVSTCIAASVGRVAERTMTKLHWANKPLFFGGSTSMLADGEVPTKLRIRPLQVLSRPVVMDSYIR